MTTTPELYRVYEAAGKDGYPPEWDEAIKWEVRLRAGHRCERCGHPYRGGEGEWSPCDEGCDHGGPIKVLSLSGDWVLYEAGDPAIELLMTLSTVRKVARWRILTVHHLNGVKLDCRWWNLVALCQKCHLQIQGKVVMERAFMFEHSEWFKPYAAAFYAEKYLAEAVTREQAMERLDELLALERLA